MGKKAAAEPKAAASSTDERPPRPSHGHKWDEEKKQWVGKGSLDERKAAKLKEASAKELPDGTVLKGYQSMPTQLLLLWSKRENRPQPRYSSAWAWDKTKYRQKVYLRDANVPANSLEFTPYDDSESEFVAKEHAALLALVKVQGNMPHERTLPEPYASVWKASVSDARASPQETKSKAKAKAKSSASKDSWEEAQDPAAYEFAPAVRAASNFASKAERDAAERKRVEDRNRREAAREMRRQADRPAPILLARSMRKQLHEALGIRDEYQSVRSDVDTDIGSNEANAVSMCVEWGFAASEALRALLALRNEDLQSHEDAKGLAVEMRKWLCLHLPEEDLPEEYAAGRGQYTVHKAKHSPESVEPLVAESPSDFKSACKLLSSWLREQLLVTFAENDADALHASAEAILFGADPESMEEDELEEVAENIVAVLMTEDGSEDLCDQLKARWKDVCTKRATTAATVEAEAGQGQEGEGVIDSPSSVPDAPVAEGFFEVGVSRDPSGSSASTGKQKARGVWFGTRAGSQDVLEVEAKWKGTTAGQAMQKQRDGLPAAKSKTELIRLTSEHPVVFVHGETGCGKTTQVGQFLLESDPKARVVVTQPRRVAATSVAHRVAVERGERIGQGSVGYSVRGESCLRRDSCRLLFCTNGVLLRRILGDPESMLKDDTCTHLVVDEVHERSVEIDLLLTLLRHLLPLRGKLRVLLMSATMDIKQLSKMFGSTAPPVLQIPGRTFPVSQLFVEDVEDQVQSWRWTGSLSVGGKAVGAIQPLQLLDFGLVADLILLALRGGLHGMPEDGAVLVFVAGVGEIERVTRELHQKLRQGEATVLPLHGGLAPDQQRRCFDVPSKTAPRKIVIATNVAETSVTVPDVTIVVDTARERRLQLESGAVATLLAEGLCARSSLQQRRGRAGRVRAGLCITLLTQREHDGLAQMPAPEIEATSLESLCLQVRVAGFSPQEFLADMPTPPSLSRVTAAESMLLRIGAVRPGKSGEPTHMEPTALGQHLAALPCDVHIGKLLVIGAFLGVSSMAADVAAMLSVRSPLKSTVKDPQAEAWRDSLRKSLQPGGGKSDHCLYAKLLQLWSSGDRRELCKNAAVVWERMAEAASVRAQLSQALRGLGFDTKSGDDRCHGEWRALRAAVTAAFYPQVARVQRPPKEFTQTRGGTIEVEAEARRLRYWVTPETGEAEQASQRDVRAFLHPASMLFKQTAYSCPWVVFSAKQLQQTQDVKYSTRLTVSLASEASIYALLLFGGHLDIEHSTAEVVIDNWIRFSGGSTTVVALVEKLKVHIEKLLLQKVATPWLRLADEPVCLAVSTLLSTDGLG